MRRVYASSFLVLLVATSACRSRAASAAGPVSSAGGAPAVSSTPSFHVDASVREVMDSVVAPSAQGLWDSVGRISDARGTVDLAPKSDADWAAVRRHAVALVESTNLLLIPGRHVAPSGAATSKADDADPGAELAPAEIERRVNGNWALWTGMANGLHDTAANMLAAIDRKDVAGLERTGGDLDGVCESCHVTFWYPPNGGK